MMKKSQPIFNEEDSPSLLHRHHTNILSIQSNLSEQNINSNPRSREHNPIVALKTSRNSNISKLSEQQQQHSNAKKFDRRKLHDLLLKRNDTIQQVHHDRRSIWSRSSNSYSHKIILVDHENERKKDSNNFAFDPSNVHDYSKRKTTMESLAELAKKQRRKEKLKSSPIGVVDLDEHFVDCQTKLEFRNNLAAGVACSGPMVGSFAASSLGMLTAESIADLDDRDSSFQDDNCTMITANYDSKEVDEECEFTSKSFPVSISSDSMERCSMITNFNKNLSPSSPVSMSSGYISDANMDYIVQLRTLFRLSPTKSIASIELVGSQLESECHVKQNGIILLRKTFDDGSSTDEKSHISELTYDGEYENPTLSRFRYPIRTNAKWMLVCMILIVYVCTNDMTIRLDQIIVPSTASFQGTIQQVKILFNVWSLTKYFKEMHISSDSKLWDFKNNIKNFQQTEGCHGGVTYQLMHDNSVISHYVSHSVMSDAIEIYFQCDVKNLCEQKHLNHRQTETHIIYFQQDMYKCINVHMKPYDHSENVTHMLLGLRIADFGFQKAKLSLLNDVFLMKVESLSYKNEKSIRHKIRRLYPNTKIQIQRQYENVGYSRNFSQEVISKYGETKPFVFQRRSPSFFNLKRVPDKKLISNVSKVVSEKKVFVQNKESSCFKDDKSSNFRCQLITSEQDTTKDTVKEYLNSVDESVTFDMNIGETLSEMMKLLLSKSQLHLKKKMKKDLRPYQGFSK